jgi:hypothetical protein
LFTKGKTYIFILIALFYTFNAQIAYAFVYDDFSGNSLNKDKWSIECIGYCQNETGIDVKNQTFGLVGNSDGNYLYLTGYNFSKGDTLDLNFNYVIGLFGFVYGERHPYPSFFPPNNVLSVSGWYHLHLVFLESAINWTVTGPNNYSLRDSFGYNTLNPVFYLGVSYGEVQYDDVTINGGPLGFKCNNYNECSINYCVHNICRSNTTFCGDNFCDIGETCNNCVVDCGCKQNEVYTQNNACLKRENTACSTNSECITGFCVHGMCRIDSIFCGDTFCDIGETCSTCNSDCTCESSYVCSQDTCKAQTGTGCIRNSDCIEGFCSHGTCRLTETFCGDSFCDKEENAFGCFDDCKQQTYPPIFLIVLGIGGVIGYKLWRKNQIALEKRRKAEEKRRKLEEEKRQEEERRRHLEEEKRRKAEEAFRKRQLAKGLVEYKDKWVTKSQYARLNEIDIGLDKNFMNMTGYQFEEFIAELFRKMGYRTYTTSKARDKGIDVIAKGHGDLIAIQCKRNKDGINVGNQAIQMARGSMDYFRANKCIVITNQDFTIDAKEQARRTKNIELWGRKKLHEKVRQYLIRDYK